MSTTPSEPARGPHDEPKGVPPAPPFYRPAAIALVAAVFPWLFIGALASTKPLKGADGTVGNIVFGLILVTIIASPFVAWFLAHLAQKKLREIHVDERPPGLRVAQVARGLAIGTVVAGFLYTLFGMTIMRGRQLRRRGKARLAPLVERAGWSDAPTRERIVAPPEVAEAWRHNALTEHASVAAFSHVALDLIAVGAPASLVRACHEAALDEVAHTELCFAIAASIDGETRAPASFADAGTRPDGDVTLSRIATEALVDGALLEGAAAHVASMLTRRATHASIVDALGVIAADERRHAEHGWRVVEWCLARDASLAAALDSALTNVPGDVDAGALDDGAGEAFGIASHATLRAAYARSLAESRARLALLIHTSIARAA